MQSRALAARASSPSTWTPTASRSDVPHASLWAHDRTMGTRLDLPAPNIAHRPGLSPRTPQDAANGELGHPTPRSPQDAIPPHHAGYRELAAGIAGWLLVGLVAGSLLISDFAQAFFALLVASVVIFLVAYQLTWQWAERPRHKHAPSPGTGEDAPE